MQTDPLNSLNGAAHDHYEALALRSLTETLNYADRAALDDHLAVCEQCRASLDEWRAIRTAVKKAARKEAFSLPPLSVEKFDRKETRLMIFRPLPLAAAVAALILTAFVIVSSQRQITAPAAVITATPMPQLAATLMPSELMRSSVPPPTSTPIPTLIPSPTVAPVPEGTSPYIVREGDTLLAILLSPPFNYAADAINSTLLDRIFELNPHIWGINNLPPPGNTIWIPVPPAVETQYIEWQDYTVQPGDTLASILLSAPYNFTLAQITPELVNEILRLNPDMDSSGALPDVGTTIRIPFPPNPAAMSGDPLYMTATAVVQQATAAALNPAEIDPLALTATQIIQEATATAIGASGLDPLYMTATAVVQQATAAALNPAEIDPLALTATQIIQEATATAIGATATATPFPIGAVMQPAGWVLRSIPLEDITTWGIPFQLNLIVNVSVSRHNPGGIGTDEYLLVPITQEAVITALDDTIITLALPAEQAELLTQVLQSGDSIYITVINTTPTPDMTGSTPTSTAMP